jgi:hypothetical protein
LNCFGFAFILFIRNINEGGFNNKSTKSNPWTLSAVLWEIKRQVPKIDSWTRIWQNIKGLVVCLHLSSHYIHIYRSCSLFNCRLNRGKYWFQPVDISLVQGPDWKLFGNLYYLICILYSHTEFQSKVYGIRTASWMRSYNSCNLHSLLYSTTIVNSHTLNDSINHIFDYNLLFLAENCYWNWFVTNWTSLHQQKTSNICTPNCAINSDGNFFSFLALYLEHFVL